MRRITLSLCALSIAACSKKAEPAPEKPQPLPAEVAPAPSEAKTDASPTEAKADAATAPSDVEPVPSDAAPAPSDAVPATGDTSASPEPGKVRGENPDAVCAVITGRSGEVRSAYRKEVDGLPPEKAGPIYIGDVDYGGCLGESARTNGAWAFELREAQIDPDSLKEGAEDGATATLGVEVIWIAPNGVEQSTTEQLSRGFFESSMEFERLHDFDRDGRPELVVTMTAGSPDHRNSELVVFRAGDNGSAEVVRLWKDTTTITGLEDIDGDSVLDLLHGNEFLCQQGMNKPYGFAGATHVVKLDQLERTDAAVKGYYLGNCPDKVSAAEIGKSKGEGAIEIDEVLTRATCAWLWGAKPADIEKAIAKAVKGSDYDAEVSCPWLSPDVKPPVTLP